MYTEIEREKGIVIRVGKVVEFVIDNSCVVIREACLKELISRDMRAEVCVSVQRKGRCYSISERRSRIQGIIVMGAATRKMHCQGDMQMHDC